ncbi:MAG: PilW family protein [Gammaproteobacteria bacterium]
MKTIRNNAGFSMMELMISLAIGLVVTSTMIALMSNSLSNTSRIVQMNNLSEELRTNMMLMSRDLRRSSYSANAIYCYGNPDCTTLGSVGAAGYILMPGDININDANTCLTYSLDRDHDGDATEDGSGGFRRVVSNGVGQIEMWIGDNSPDCASTHANWVALSDNTKVDITSFVVNDNLSYNETLVSDGDGNTLETQRVRRIRMSIDGQLINDTSITRTIENVIKIRNNFWF